MIRYQEILSIATSDNLLKFKKATKDISPDLKYAKRDPTQRVDIGLLLSNNLTSQEYIIQRLSV